MAKLTPAQRKAMLEEAEKLLHQAEADEGNDLGPSTQGPAVGKPGAIIGMGQTVIPVVTGPGGDTRQTKQPSLWQTLMGVAKIMKGQK